MKFLFSDSPLVKHSFMSYYGSISRIILPTTGYAREEDAIYAMKCNEITLKSLNQKSSSSGYGSYGTWGVGSSGTSMSHAYHSTTPSYSSNSMY